MSFMLAKRPWGPLGGEHAYIQISFLLFYSLSAALRGIFGFQEQRSYFKDEIIDNEYSIKENVRDEIHDNQTEIWNKIDLENKDESVTKPINYNDAIIYEQANKWKQAMNDELDSPHQNKTWTLVS
ncbi:Uncharacterized protein FWK35_00016107 [Aphis craccivora]|uniref:Uncharacterized protein n=1 Tax=Aphis craccivora TaxID=307492 RepID=A0A6G0Y6A1_APHCR|nr:Uncharacterized protein FWK35_00016107 [Aphis craccivora]